MVLLFLRASILVQKWGKNELFLNDFLNIFIFFVFLLNKKRRKIRIIFIFLFIFRTILIQNSIIRKAIFMLRIRSKGFFTILLRSDFPFLICDIFLNKFNRFHVCFLIDILIRQYFLISMRVYFIAREIRTITTLVEFNNFLLVNI